MRMFLIRLPLWGTAGTMLKLRISSVADKIYFTEVTGK